MASIRREAHIKASPDQVWDALRDWGAVHERLARGFVVDVTLDGTDRIVTFFNGVVVRERFVACDPDPPIRRAIAGVLRRAGVGVMVFMLFDTVGPSSPAIASAAGVSILPRPAVAKEVGIRTLDAVPLAIGRLVRPIAIIHRKGKRLPPAVDRFIDLLRKAGNREAPSGRAEGTRP